MRFLNGQVARSIRWVGNTRWVVGIVFVTLLAACSFAPLPFNERLEIAPNEISISVPTGQVNLLPLLGENRSGELGPFPTLVAPVTLDVVTLANQLGIEVVIPLGGDGFTFDFSNEPLPAELTGASLTYSLEVSVVGPVSADVTLQPYLAPINEARLLSEVYALGAARPISVDEGATQVMDTIQLNGAQLEAINSGRLRFAVAVTEGSLTFEEVGAASLAYSFNALNLDIESVSAAVSERIPSAEGGSFDFSDVDVPGPGRIVNLGVDYTINLSFEGVGGSASAQLYLAPLDAENVFAESYAFGERQAVNLDSGQVTLSDRASLSGDQRRIIREQAFRYGVLIEAEPDVALGRPIVIRYEFEDLELFGGYSLN